VVVVVCFIRIVQDWSLFGHFFDYTEVTFPPFFLTTSLATLELGLSRVANESGKLESQGISVGQEMSGKVREIQKISGIEKENSTEKTWKWSIWCF